MAQDELRSIVEQVGDRFNLGEYEIGAYLAVLEHGQLTASEIAEQTTIPQPRVYDTVRSLSDRGLVELRESRPMKVVAIEPGDAFDDVQSTLERMIDELNARYTAPAQDTEAVSLVKSRSTIIRYVEDVIEAAEYELSLSLTPDLLVRLEEKLRETTEQKISVDLLVTPASQAPDETEFDYQGVATRVRTRRGITTPVIAVADGNYSIYATQDALRDDQDRYGVIFNRSALGFLVSGFFGTVLWTTTETVITEQFDERPFPRRYASIRRCVKDLIDEGGEFYATIAGRDVVTGASRVVRGQIVDISFELTEEVAGMTLETEDGTISVGGRVAALEDIEAHEIRISERDPPPLET